MQLEKVIEVTLDIPNPINFCGDKNRHVLNLLRNQYLGRCYKGAFIVGIKSVMTEESKCHLVRSNIDAEGFMDVRFLADVVIYGQWDVLIGVEVIKSEIAINGIYRPPPLDGQVSARAVVSFTRNINQERNRDIESLVDGQLVPVRIVRALYTPMQTDVSLAVTLLTCDCKAPVFKVKGVLEMAKIESISYILKSIERELITRKAMMDVVKDKVLFFEGLLYSYKQMPTGTQMIPSKINGVPDWEGPSATDSSHRNLLELLSKASKEPLNVTGYWSRSLNICRSSPVVSFLGKDPIPQSIDVIPHMAFGLFMNNVLSFMVAVREMVERYSDENINSSTNIWHTMRSAQRKLP